MSDKTIIDLPEANLNQSWVDTLACFWKSAHAYFVVFTKEQTGPNRGF
jgi:hypothetical protein